MKLRKKLIEVALPLEAINKASAREKSIRHGHPSTLHLWWARRPLAAARAVIFGQMVDDPSEYVDTLLRDPQVRRRAESDLKKRHKIWTTAAATYRKALDAGIEAPAPGEEPTLESIAAEHERSGLFKIIEKLVQWENTTNDRVLQEAREEIWQSWRRTCADNADHPRASELFDRNKLPAFHDPFAGGGALPLEAQRLGLEAHASDLNPVAVLINKAMIEIPPKFAGRPPVNPEWQAKPDSEKAMRVWKGAEGLAEDVRYYGKWMRDEAEKRIGHLYPPIEVTAEMAEDRPELTPYVGQKLTVIAWLWARTVKSPNPAFARVDVPLASTFMLSTKSGSEAYVEPTLEADGYRFAVKLGAPRDPESANAGTKLARGNFKCLMSGTPIDGDYIKSEGRAGRMSARLMAIVTEHQGRRLYLSPVKLHEDAATPQSDVTWRPDGDIPTRMTGGNCTPYGLTKWVDLFTARQLSSLATLSELVGDAMERVQRDAITSTVSAPDGALREGGRGAQAYSEAVAVYLGFCVDKATLTNSTQATWQRDPDRLTQGFSRQALPMTWDYAEANPLSDAGGGFGITSLAVAKVLERLPASACLGEASQLDAATGQRSVTPVVSTDPPYYDNIAYADLSDYFYVWMRHSMRQVFPEMFATVAVPKTEELVATVYRHGSKEKAEAFFLDGMTQAMRRLAEHSHPAFPVTIYYAFKQSEREGGDGLASTGWETFLDAVNRAGFGVSGTWPMRTELVGNLKKNMGALASSIVLVCRRRANDARSATRRELLSALRSELPSALRKLQEGYVAPVDLAQAAIGPGMAVFTRYAKVLDAEDRPISVRDALVLINQVLAETLSSQEGDFDLDTQWALAWFDQFGLDEGSFGLANVLAQAKNTSVDGLVHAGIVASVRGKVRLLRPEELPPTWEPATDARLTVWEMTHHLVRALEHDGEPAAAELVLKLGSRAETARELCYRLYSVCEQKKRATEALRYNTLVQSWPEIVRLAAERGTQAPTQQSLMEP